MVVQAFGNEKGNLSEELQAAKEKLHSCEVRCFSRFWLNLCQILKKRVEGFVSCNKGAFTNYVDKRRGVGKQSKNVNFLSTFIR